LKDDCPEQSNAWYPGHVPRGDGTGCRLAQAISLHAQDDTTSKLLARDAEERSVAGGVRVKTHVNPESNHERIRPRSFRQALQTNRR
jgi:hypothetical protein